MAATRTEDLTTILNVAVADASSISSAQEPSPSSTTRVYTQRIFELLSNYMDQAFHPVWEAQVGSLLSDKERARAEKHVGMPVCQTREQLYSRLGQMKAREAYERGGEFKALIDSFQAIDCEDQTYVVIRTMANRKHKGPAALQRKEEAGLVLGGIPGPLDIVIRRLRVETRQVDGVQEMRITVDGGSFNILSGLYDLPLPANCVRVEKMAEYILHEVPGGAVSFVMNAVTRLRGALPRFEALAGGFW